MDIFKAFGAYVALDYMNRKNNYYEMEERLKGHIRRWEDALERLESAHRRTHENLIQNTERLRKAKNFHERLTSSASMGWQDRQQSIVDSHPNAERRAEACSKLAEHGDKLASVVERIGRLERWIDDGEQRLREISGKVSSIEDKISDAKRKIR